MLKSILALDFLDQIVHLKDLEDAALSAALLTYMEKQKVSAMRKSSASRRRFRQRKSLLMVDMPRAEILCFDVW